MSIECSSRPQKKATAHHRKTRPRKSQPWDIKRKPTVYAPLPPLPPDWTLVSSSGDGDGDGDGDGADLPSTTALEAPVTSG
jgi:50S ribosomal protein 6